MEVSLSTFVSSLGSAWEALLQKNKELIKKLTTVACSFDLSSVEAEAGGSEKVQD